MTGVLGLLAGTAFGYSLFREPRRRIHKKSGRKSRWLSDSLPERAMKKIYKLYNIVEPLSLDEENDDKLFKVGYDEIKARPFFEENETPGLWQGLPLISKTLIVFGALWPFVFYALLRLAPALFVPFKDAPLMKGMFIFPTCVMAILNGMILLSQQNTMDGFEEKPKRNGGWLAGIVSLLLGCGLGVFLIFKGFIL